MEACKKVKGILSIKKSWFEPISAFAFTVEDYLTDMECRTRIVYDDYQPVLNKAQQAKKDIKDYIVSNNLTSTTRKELESEIICSQSNIKIAIKELVSEKFFIEQGHTRDKVFIVNTECFKPNSTQMSVAKGGDLDMDI